MFLGLTARTASSVIGFVRKWFCKHSRVLSVAPLIFGVLDLGGCSSLYLVDANGKLFKVERLDLTPNGQIATFYPGTDAAVPRPAGLSRAGCANALFVLDGMGNQVFDVNAVTGAHILPSPIPGIANLPPFHEGLATSGRGDQLYYCRSAPPNTSGGCNLFVYSLPDGVENPTPLKDLGTVFRQPFTLTGLTLNPADGMLYGTGRDANLDKWLFRIATDGTQFSCLGKTRFGGSQSGPGCGGETGGQPIGVAGLEFYGGSLYGIDNQNIVPVPDPNNSGPNPLPHLLVINPSNGQVEMAFRTAIGDGQGDRNLGQVTDLAAVSIVAWYVRPLCWRDVTTIVIIAAAGTALLVFFMFRRRAKGA
jgi:hypothetical protein